MPRFLLLFLLPLFVFAFLGYYAATFPSTVFLKFSVYEIKINLVIWFIFSFVVAWLLLTIARIIKLIIRTPKKISNRYKNNQEKKSYQLLQKGLQQLSDGLYKKAEKSFYQGGQIAEQNNQKSSIFYENASLAAHYLNEPERSEIYALKARQNSINHNKIFEAELFFMQKNYQNAANILEKELQDQKNNPKILLLLSKCYEQLNNWEKSCQLLPKLKKHLNKDEYQQKQIKYTKNLLLSIDPQLTDQQKIWQSLPDNIKNSNDFVILYAELLLNQNKTNQAEKLLINYIKKTKDLLAIQALGQIRSNNPKKLLGFFNQIEKHYPNDDKFKFAKAQSAFFAQDYRIAHEIVDSILEKENDVEIQLLLAQILEAEEQKEQALIAYKKALANKYQDKSLQGQLVN